jgi:hypothetical protein
MLNASNEPKIRIEESYVKREPRPLFCHHTVNIMDMDKDETRVLENMGR